MGNMTIEAASEMIYQSARECAREGGTAENAASLLEMVSTHPDYAEAIDLLAEEYGMAATVRQFAEAMGAN